MIRTLSLSLIVAATLTLSAKGQVLQPGANPQPLPGSPSSDALAPRRSPRMRPTMPPPAMRPMAQSGTAPEGARRPAISAFVVLPGLSERGDYLLSDLGYESGKTFPLTPQTTFDLAYKCYADGCYSDAMVFASHGLQMCNDARLHLLKGICELHRGMGTAAEQTAVDYRNALAAQQVLGIDAARERINDAMTLRFADIVQYQATGR
jgi:hypothetical protein